jgi:uracil phosphoribosyltransferase
MQNLTVIEHPLLRRDLTVLRRTETPHGAFRKKVSDAAAILAYEAMSGVEVEETRIQTPLEETTGYEVADRVVVVPILRAGLGLMNGFLRFVPEAHVGHLGMQRNEETHEPEGYYAKLPDGLGEAHVFVVDPMLATGGSATSAVSALKEEGAARLTFACLVAAPEGVKALEEAHPDVPVVAAALDRELDGNAFIRPGLGDAGDRIYGT